MQFRGGRLQPVGMDEPGSASGTERRPGSEQEHDPEQTPDAEPRAESGEPATTGKRGDTERPRDSVRSVSDDGSRAFTETAKLGAGIAVVGIVGTGMLDFALSQYVSPAAGRLVWAVGFTLTVLVLWYVVLRPMEITGP